MRARKNQRTFAPWRRDFAAALILVCAGCAALYGGVAMHRASSVLAGAGMAAVFFMGARRAYQHGYGRWYGKNLEDWAIESARSVMDRKRIRYEVGRLVPGHGDVDLLIHGRAGSCVIEIKAIERWRQTLWQRGERETAAVQQAARLRDVMSAQGAIIWLPRGRRTFAQWLFGAGGSGVRVVFGDVPKMLKSASRHAGVLNKPWDGIR